MSRRRALASGVVTALALMAAAGGAHAAPMGPGPATSDGGASWVSAPAQAPPTPTGASASPYPVALGYVGDIEFWAPNRGLLITAGNSLVPEGLYAYNGSAWHELSSVCGGSDGRIAWAGPDEFWTIADQRPGSTETNTTQALQDVSLCHFLNGQVVGSYALPLGQPNSYQPMNAAACDSTSDCWFGGNLAAGGGAFHLHWDGSNVTEVDAPEGHVVASMTVDNDQIYESVQINQDDTYLAGESMTNPPVLKVIVPSHPNPFVDLFPTDTQCSPVQPALCPPLPEYASGTQPYLYNGLALSSDWRAGATDPQLWAAAGGGYGSIVLFEQNGTWTQVVPNLTDFSGANGTEAFPLGQQLQGGITPVAQSVAADPGEQAAWIAISANDGEAHVDRLAMTGPNAAAVTDVDVLGDPQGVGPRGGLSAIACPAENDCWAATSEGWLFHLTDGTQLPVDTDANFAGVIAYRPPDAGVPQLPAPSEAQPAATVPPVPTVTPISQGSGSRHTKHVHVKPVIEKFGKPRLEGANHDMLALPITLSVPARVQLIGKLKGKIVARSPVERLRAGRHVLLMRLDVHRYPTKLAVRAHATGKRSSKPSHGDRLAAG